jgi:hypothetical protein
VITAATQGGKLELRLSFWLVVVVLHTAEVVAEGLVTGQFFQ